MIGHVHNYIEESKVNIIILIFGKLLLLFAVNVLSNYALHIHAKTTRALNFYV